MIMLCVTTISFSFKLNGDLVGYVHPERGIQPGDPLSPYLFVICVEGLSASLTKATINEDLQGIKVCRDAPSIHHLFFADDSFLFAHGTIGECLNIKQVLCSYKMASGQVLNFEQSYVSFSPNLTSYDKQLLADCLGMRRVDFHDKYLGLLVLDRKSKKETFEFATDKLWNN